jgi:hypothetical protein
MEKEIKITVKAPCECTELEFKEWVEFSLGYMGGIKLSNPLHEYDLEATDVEIN